MVKKSWDWDPRILVRNPRDCDFLSDGTSEQTATYFIEILYFEIFKFMKFYALPCFLNFGFGIEREGNKI